MSLVVIACLIHSFATWFLIGLIWTIQIVHYPLLRRVAEEHFVQYEIEHQRRIAFLVVPTMIMEAVSFGPIVYGTFGGLDRLLQFIGMLLLVIIWASTLWIQMPLHKSLARKKDARDLARLIQTNWLRTAAWSARGIVTLLMLWSAYAARS